MKYAVQYSKVKGGYKVEFPDFPGLEVTAETAESIETDAYDALIGKLMSYMEVGTQVPLPVNEPDPAYITLVASVPPKILLHNIAVSQNRSRSWIASQMGVSRQVMTRIFNLRESTKVETIQNALDPLGYDLSVTLEPKTKNHQF